MNVFSGTSGNDRLEGTVGDDLIIGLEGRDTLISNGGDDTLSGGSGNDAFYQFTNPPSTPVILQLDVDGGDDFDVVRLDFEAFGGGSAFDLVLSDSLIDERASGGLASIANVEMYSLAGESDGTVDGSALQAVQLNWTAEAGSQTIVSGAQNDTFSFYVGDNLSHVADGNDGTDYIGIDYIRAPLNGSVGPADAEITATTYTDSANAFDVSFEDFERIGVLMGDYGGLVDASAATARIFANASFAMQASTLIGGSADDQLTSGDGINLLVGNGGNDDLNLTRAGTADGSAGDDTLTAYDAPFARTLTGGLGNDLFEVFSMPDGIQITDFEPGDLIRVSGVNGDFSTYPIFLGTGAFTGAGNELRVNYTATETFLEADGDGDLITDRSVVLTNGLLEIASVADSRYLVLETTGTLSTGGNQAPVAVDDLAATDTTTPISIDALANDSDPDGDQISITAVSADLGAVSINLDSTIQYDPDGAFPWLGQGMSATATVTYTLWDGQASDTGSVIVTVNHVSTYPITGTAGNDRLEGTQGNDLIQGLAGNDTLISDIGDDTLEGGSGNDWLRQSSSGSQAGAPSRWTADGGDDFDYAVLGFTGFPVDLTLTDMLVSEVTGGFIGNISDIEVFRFSASGGAVDASGLSTVQLEWTSWSTQSDVTAGPNDDRISLYYGATNGSLVDGGAGRDTVDLRLFGGPYNINITDSAVIDATLGVDIGLTDIEALKILLPSQGGVFDASQASIDVALTGIGVIAGVTLIGGSGNDSFWSSNGESHLSGGGGNDSFVLSSSAATVADGGAGHDTLLTQTVGTLETLTGGSGDDLFHFLNDFDGDVITDLETGDVIDVSLLAQSITDRPVFLGAAEFDGTQDALRYAHGAGETLFEFDEDGDQIADMTLTLEGGLYVLEQIPAQAGTYRTTGAPASDEADLISGGVAADILDGGDGDDTLEGGAGADTLSGGSGQDNFVGTAAELDGDVITDAELGETIVVEGAFFTEDDITTTIGSLIIDVDLDGDDASDMTLTLAGSVPSAYGLELVDGANGTTIVLTEATNGDGIVNGAAASEVMTLGFTDADGDAITQDADVIHGNLGNDTIRAGGGDDTLDGGFGADRLDGEAGFDTADFSAANGGVNVGLTVLGSKGQAQGDILVDIERLIGSNFADVLIGRGTGTVLIGGAGPDELRDQTGAGDIQIFGGSGQDTLLGRDGQDTLFGGDNNDVIRGEADGDLIMGEHGNDTLRGGTGDDAMHGGLGNDIANGDQGNDTIAGGDGRDRLFGNDNDDLISGDSGLDFLVGGDGNDEILGGADTDRLYGNQGNDTLFGTGENSGRDFLFGGDDNDVIHGAHDDHIEGGGGADIFIFTLGCARVTISDFMHSEDLIDLSSIAGLEFTDLTIQQINTRVRVDFGAQGDHLILLGTNIADIDNSDFMFGVG